MTRRFTAEMNKPAECNMNPELWMRQFSWQIDEPQEHDGEWYMVTVLFVAEGETIYEKELKRIKITA